MTFALVDFSDQSANFLFLFFFYYCAGSFEQSPNLSDVYGYWTESELSRLPRGNTENNEEEDSRLREHIADAMLESPHRDGGGPTSLRGEPVSITWVIFFFF